MFKLTIKIKNYILPLHAAAQYIYWHMFYHSRDTYIFHL